MKIPPENKIILKSFSSPNESLIVIITACDSCTPFIKYGFSPFLTIFKLLPVLAIVFKTSNLISTEITGASIHMFSNTNETTVCA